MKATAVVLFSLLGLVSVLWGNQNKGRSQDVRTFRLAREAVGESVRIGPFFLPPGTVEVKLEFPADDALCMCVGKESGCRPFCGFGPVVSGTLKVSQEGAALAPRDYDTPGTFYVLVYTRPPKSPRTADIDGRLSVLFSPDQQPAPEHLSAGATLLSGTATATTNAARPTTAGLAFAFDSAGSCVLKVEAPLWGSGRCWVRKYELGGDVEIVSEGPLSRILWLGAFQGPQNVVGTFYAANLAQPSLPEWGTFGATIGTGPIPGLAELIQTVPIEVDGKAYLAVRERNLISLHTPDGVYAGRRLLLSPDGNPMLVAIDSNEGTRILDPKTDAVVMEWVTDGTQGYNVLRRGSISIYSDRFMNLLPWVRVQLDDKNEVFARREGDFIELFDKNLKPLNFWGNKSPSGQRYWCKVEGDVAVYYDEHFQPLNWYAMLVEGQLLYANRDSKGRLHYFDAQLRPLRDRPSFWRKLATVIALGLSAYGSALRAAAALPPSPPVLPPPPLLIAPGQTTAVTNRVGNTVFSNAWTSTGANALLMTQRIGNMDFTTGVLPRGRWVQGTVVHVGDTSLLHFQSSIGPWFGMTQTLGNITFHNFFSLVGGGSSGFSQRVGDFIFTTAP